MNFPRSSGILLHITSLPGEYGIGEMGKEAYSFIDFLADTGQKLWQILPLVPTGFANSPYTGTSIFAGNPLLISTDKLKEEGLLNSEDISDMPDFPDNRVDYNTVNRFKDRLLKKAFHKFNNTSDSGLKNEFADFRKQNEGWLDAYALYTTIREQNNFLPWNSWDKRLKTKEQETLNILKQKHQAQIDFHKFVQFLFYRQWYQLKQYSNEHGINIIGDMPFYVNMDSDTVWSHPEFFRLDDNYEADVISGVPPDYFSETGQLWGNPIYKWSAIQETGYKWWIERFRSLMSLVDIIRIDHFRGFETYWEVPAGENTAINGKWEKGPGMELFQAVEEELGHLPVIAEDLGMITPEVIELRDKLGFPGMRVLQFAFSDDSKDNPHKPFNYPLNSVAYTGTHDNDTVTGWYNGDNDTSTRTSSQVVEERNRALKYLGTDGSNISQDFMRLCLSSVSNTAIIPMQDILGLGNEARMNTPGRADGNWEWRFGYSQLREEKRSILKELTTIYGR
jgi:4-alpha-glucanotransferase